MQNAERVGERQYALCARFWNIAEVLWSLKKGKIRVEMLVQDTLVTQVGSNMGLKGNV